MYPEHYENIYQLLIELYDYQLLLELADKEDTEEYAKLNKYIDYLYYTYLTPKFVGEVFRDRVITGELDYSDFRYWVKHIVNREDLLQNFGL